LHTLFGFRSKAQTNYFAHRFSADARPCFGEAIVQNVVPKFSATASSVDFLGRKMGEGNEAI
jgi:hypothetical protein